MMDGDSETSDNSADYELIEDTESLSKLHKSSFGTSVFNFNNSSLCTGLLSMGFAYLNAGYVLGLILEIFFLVLSTLSYFVLVKLAD